MQWTEAPIIMIDTETTGLLWTQSRVLEVAAIAFRLTADALEPEFLGSYQSLINPGAQALSHPETAQALAINHISELELERAPSFKEVARQLSSYIDGIAESSPKAGFSVSAFNAGFDFRMLAAEWLRSGQALPAWLQAKRALDTASGWIDPMVWCRDAERRAKGGHSLDRQRERLGLPPDGDAHRALTDVQDAAKVLNWLVNGGHPGLSLARDPGQPLASRDILLARQDILATTQSLDLQTFLYNKRT